MYNGLTNLHVVGRFKKSRWLKVDVAKTLFVCKREAQSDKKKIVYENI